MGHYPSVTFACDVRRCKETLVVADYYKEGAGTSAHLDLVAAGWKVCRNSIHQWQYVCTTHELADLKATS